MLDTPSAALASGLVLGLSAGIAPGPMLALVIAETLTHSVRSGVRVAMAPLLTDVPIILLSVLVLQGLAASDAVLGVIAVAGGLYLLYLARESLRATGLPPDAAKAAPRSLRKGVTTNLLNPHPYLFWITVGGPMLVRGAGGAGAGWLAPALFLAAFYASLVGAKVGVALLTGRMRDFVRSRAYVLTMRLLGLALLLFALLLFREGALLLGGAA
jgi:threonine/homoserine/homoserine lactone efflux protein